MKNRILIIENNLSDELLIKKILENKFELVIFHNSMDSYNFLINNYDDLVSIILNIDIVESNNLIKKIKNNKVLCDLPLIASKYYDEAKIDASLLDEGVTEFIYKPYRKALINKRINNIVDLYIKEKIAKNLLIEKDELKQDSYLYKKASLSGGRVISVYDFNTDTYYFRDNKDKLSTSKTALIDPQKNLIEKGFINEDSKTEFLKFCDKIKNGSKSCDTYLWIKNDKNKNIWAKCEASIIFDKISNPITAVIAFTDVTEEFERDNIYKKWKQSLRLKNKEFYSLFQTDLNKNSELITKDGKLLLKKIKAKEDLFDDLIAKYANKYVDVNYRSNFIKEVNRQTILANYYKNKNKIIIEYLESYNNTSIWIRLTIETIEMTFSSNVEAFLMFENIDVEKNLQLKTKELAEKDALTGAFNRIAFIKKMEKKIEENSNLKHAILMIDIDNFKKVNDNYGHLFGDRELMNIVNVINSIIRHDDLLGRIGGDEFAVFLFNIASVKAIEKKAKIICEKLKKQYNDNFLISASIGLAIYPDDGDNFTSLYHNADEALYKAKTKKNQYCFFKKDLEINKALSSNNNKNSQASNLNSRKKLLIVSDNKLIFEELNNILKNDYNLYYAKDGEAAKIIIKHYEDSLAMVLVEVLESSFDNYNLIMDIKSYFGFNALAILAIVKEDKVNHGIDAIRSGANDFITYPFIENVLRSRINASLSEVDIKKIAAQNDYLLLQQKEEEKYKIVLESTDTVVIDFDWITGTFKYSDSISKHIAGKFDDRRFWKILLSDMVATSFDVMHMQEFIRKLAEDRNRLSGSMNVKLKVPSGEIKWFKMSAYKNVNSFYLTKNIIMTFLNIDDEIIIKDNLQNQAEKDELTGLLNRNAFFKKAQSLILNKPASYYVLVSFDIKNFKILNDIYGSEIGDKILIYLSKVFSNCFERNGGISGRISGDDFIALYPITLLGSEELAQCRKDASLFYDHIKIDFKVGRYIVDDLTLSISAMYDRALIAQASLKNKYDKNICLYNESMRSDIINYQLLINEMHKALQDKEFEIWIQPQYNHLTKSLIGSEALVRWNHPKKGIISPSEFIPLFEKNGFIYELDKYILITTCEYIKQSMKENIPVVPISVNISRIDLVKNDFLNFIEKLIENYDFCKELLRLEITESAFSNDASIIIEVIKKLVEKGFIIEIDDFGSGYSSFNALKDVPAQILKIDMRFLESTKDLKKRNTIIKSVVRMAKWLGMSVIAEGVEDLMQADFLSSIGCNFIQGYFYSKPLKISDYEKLLKQTKINPSLTVLETNYYFKNRNFWNTDSVETYAFNNFIGSACVLELYKNTLEIIRANLKCARTIGGKDFSINDVMNVKFINHLKPIDKQKILNLLNQMKDFKEEFTFDAIFYNIGANGKDIHLLWSFQLMAKTVNRYLFFCHVLNLSDINL